MNKNMKFQEAGFKLFQPIIIENNLSTLAQKELLYVIKYVWIDFKG